MTVGHHAARAYAARRRVPDPDLGRRQARVQGALYLGRGAGAVERHPPRVAGQHPPQPVGRDVPRQRRRDEGVLEEQSRQLPQRVPVRHPPRRLIGAVRRIGHGPPGAPCEHGRVAVVEPPQVLPGHRPGIVAGEGAGEVGAEVGVARRRAGQRVVPGAEGERVRVPVRRVVIRQGREQGQDGPARRRRGRGELQRHDDLPLSPLPRA
mmetsp:Transcript_4856/g.10951  ORF Transcript_4856/g.10951 Transcript_4856/m.10951 type:complete len:208 (-) Transcript_4856:218-841(-)